MKACFLLLFLVTGCVIFISLQRAIPHKLWAFFALLLGVAVFYASTLLHYYLPTLSIPLWQIVLSALVEETLRLLALQFFKRQNSLSAAALLMIIALVYAILESVYYISMQTSTLLILFRLIGAWPLHLGNAFFIATLHKLGYTIALIFHILYNYFILINAPLFMPFCLILLLCYVSIKKYRFLQAMQQNPKVKFF